MASPTQAPPGWSRTPFTAPPVVRVAGSNGRGPNGSGAAARMRQITTNNWARKRITDLGKSLELPEPVRRRSLELYERIVDLHTPKDLLPPGKRRQLSPRLNWSLVYTTVYLACRVEEHPKDLRDILGPNAKPGALREMYRLYRFYKRQLRLSIKLLDVKTFIQSWIDGFELSELAFEKATPGENERLKVRAVRIASRARGDRSLRDTSTKVIAAGALTTALAERERPGNLSRFYRAIAEFLHMSEETIRLIVARITAIM